MGKVKAFFIGLLTGILTALAAILGIAISENLGRRKTDHIVDSNKMIKSAPDKDVDDLPKATNHQESHKQEIPKAVEHIGIQKDFERFMRNRE